ncbi:peptidoglycan-binding protein [bacterium]|nr:peptidoglycan-binding protein [bacterium]
MAKRKNKGGFNSMDFIIVGGIAAIAYFLFGSFTTKRNVDTSNNNNQNNNQITPPPADGSVTTQSTTTTTPNFYYFTDAELNTLLYKGMPKNLMVRALQIYLTYRGCNPMGIDGVFGTNTEDALIRCRTRNFIEDQSGDDAQVKLKGLQFYQDLVAIDVARGKIIFKNPDTGYEIVY